MALEEPLKKGGRVTKKEQEFKKCNGAQMTPMAQTYVLGIVYGLVNDKQFEWL